VFTSAGIWVFFYSRDQRRALPKVVTPSAKRRAIAIMTERPHELSIQRACRAMRLSRAAYYRPPLDRLVQDQPVVDAFQTIAAKRTASSRSRSRSVVWS
jgi:putative transposase